MQKTKSHTLETKKSYALSHTLTTTAELHRKGSEKRPTLAHQNCVSKCHPTPFASLVKKRVCDRTLLTNFIFWGQLRKLHPFSRVFFLCKKIFDVCVCVCVLVLVEAVAAGSGRRTEGRDGKKGDVFGGAESRESAAFCRRVRVPRHGGHSSGMGRHGLVRTSTKLCLT